MGWVYANYFAQIATNNIFSIEFDGTNVIKLTFKDNFGVDVTNAGIGITNESQIRFRDYPDSRFNSTWTVFSPNGDAFNSTNNYVHFQIYNNINIATVSWKGAGGITDVAPGVPVPAVDFSNSSWKEYGLVGAEVLRANTETVGDYKLGINTVARSSHDDCLDAFSSDPVLPRANLDIVGTTFISGKTINSYLTESSTIKTETNQDDAFLVGGDSDNPSDNATFRVMTTNNGRVGINTAVNDTINPYKSLDKTFVVVGDARIHENLEVTGDLEVNDGDLTTTNNAFNFINQNANVLNWAGEGQILNLLNNSSVTQSINIGNATGNQTLLVGEVVSNGTIKIHRNTSSSTVDIATVTNDVTSTCNITMGGAWATQSDTASSFKIGTFYTGLSGNLEIGTGYGAGTSSSRLFTQTRVANLFDGDQTNTINFATNATTLQMGSSGGTTTIRNTLNVLASAIVEGNIRLDGGLNAGIIEIGRGRFGTTKVGHQVGGVDNPNIDFYKYVTTGRVIDTAGVSAWGSNTFLVAGGQIAAIDNTVNNGEANRTPGNYAFLEGTSDGAGEGASFTVLVRFDKTIDISIDSPGEGYANDETITITDAQLGGGGGGDLTFQVNGTNSTGNNYYLPISTPSIVDFQVGQLLLLDRGSSFSPDSVGSGSNILTGLRTEAESEIVRITGIANVANPADPNGYRLIVNRGQEGTGTYTNHPDGCVIAILDKQANASYITGSDLNSDGQIDEPISGIGNGSGNVRIGIAEFGGTLTTADFLRLSQNEFVSVVDLVSTSPQSLIVNDGGDPASDTFRVESTTGDTYILGDIAAGIGFNKFTVNSVTGNTFVEGTLTTENTLTINGSTIENQQFFTITNGGATGIPIRTTLEVDTATGDLTINGGDMNFFGNDGTTPRLTFDNSSGDFTVYGSFSALGTGVSTFGGSLDIDGGINLEFQEGVGRTAIDSKFEITNTDGNSIFQVSDNGALRVAQIDNYITSSGGRKWEYIGDTAATLDANVNYFVNCSGNTLLRLPANPQMGDMIRIIDISGSLTYNQTMVVRAPDNAKVQKEVSNTGDALLSGIQPSETAGWNGGELIVQTPNAAFGLVYAGQSGIAGAAGAGALAGWYLMDV